VQYPNGEFTGDVSGIGQKGIREKRL
jgi:hypothetical protein